MARTWPTPTGTASAATQAIERKWTQELLIAAMLDWLQSYGSLPSSYDWSRTHANCRGGAALKRLNDRKWPPASVVGQRFGAGREIGRPQERRRGRPVRSIRPLIDARDQEV
jgi:hypothetical protein